MNISRVLLAAALVGAPSAFSVETKTWAQNDQQTFEKGTLKGLSLRSDGRLSLAPVFKELADPSIAYLWALAVDTRGTVYAGGGSPGATSARLVAADPSGKLRTVADLPGLQIQAIAVDKGDRVYAATAPDGKVYRVASDGKHEVFYDPKAKYIWSMAFNSRGDLFVATGDAGEVHRVRPDGKGDVFFRTEETHARSLAIDSKDNLIVGTEPGGLILRVTPVGDGFVLYQAGKREVTSVAVAPDGTIYAAAVGNKTPGTAAPSLSIPPPVISPAPSATPAAPGGARPPVPTVPVTTPSSSASPVSVAGGSEVYRIGTDGYPQRVWSHPQDIVYTIAFDAAGRPVLATGNKGNLYRIDSELVSTLLVNAAPTQVTALASAPKGRLFAATGNVGKIFQIGPDLERQGWYESEPLDGGSFSYWGRVRQRADLNGGNIKVETRSGNLDRPQKNWSPWAPADAQARVVSPSARFLQYRLTLGAATDGRSPDLREIEVAYMAKNVAPVIEDVEITPANYRVQPPALASSTPQTLTLPALGSRRRGASSPGLSLDLGGSSLTMQYAKGYIGARWAVADPNGDDLIYRVEIRGVGEREWKLVRDKIREKYLTWESTVYPDGEYVLRVTASDSVENPPDLALSTQLESERFTIDNTPPQITALSAAGAGNKLLVRWHARDERALIKRAEYSLNGGDWIIVEPATRLSDAPELDYSITLGGTSGEATVAVRVTDEFDNQSVEKVVVR